jgi:anti-sigma B factor antagonist
MKHTITQQGGTAVVAFEGEVDLEHSPTARRVLLDCVEEGSDVIVDMSAVAYIDSSGIASLVEALQTARRKHTRFSLAAVSPAAMRVFQLARLDRVFTIHPTVADGTASSPQ